MIPSSNGFSELTIKEQTSRTHRMNRDDKSIRGTVDGAEAVKQAIYKILDTERYRHVIYSRDYGVELMDLHGQPLSCVLPEIKRRTEEALTADDRITGVEGFRFETAGRTVLVSFTVRTVFGDAQVEKAVEY